MKMLFLFLLLLSQQLLADVIFMPEANLDLEFHQYKSFTQKHRSRLGLKTNFTDNLFLLNSINVLYFEAYEKQDKRINLNNKNLEIFLGENYLNYTNNNSQIRVGYQIVSWGESFAFNYADIINPKDQRETFYFDYSNSRLPSFMINYRYFFMDGALELIYSPEVRYSKSLPLPLIINNEMTNINLATKIRKKERFFNENDFGAKVSQTIEGADLSLFYYNYMDKNPHYSIFAFEFNKITIAENYNRIKSQGLSLAKTIYDEYVFRADFVYHQDKIINTYKDNQLLNNQSDLREFTASIDSPSFYNISGLLLYAQSDLTKDLPGSFRTKHLHYGVARLTYDFKEDRKLDLSYTREFPNDAQAILTVINYPYNDTLEIRLGAEYYWGNKNSQLNRLKDISSIFIGFKNYFSL